MPDFAAPFQEALRHWLSKQLLPTGMNSAQIAANISASLRRQSVFSAETYMTDYLDRMQKVLGSVLGPEQQAREGEARPVNVGLNPATAKEALRAKLKELGWTPAAGLEGTIKDLSSDTRLNLVINTNVELAQGMGHVVQANLNQDVVNLWPAWEFIRAEGRKEPRQWEGANGLWINACRRAGDERAIRVYGKTGRMCALKSSGAWFEISNSAYTPGGLDQPCDPAAFGTGMVREEMNRDECEAVGLLEAGEKVEPMKLDFGNLFGQ